MSHRFRNEGRESTFELELAPMLALFVSLIPMLLLNAQFTKMAIVDAPVPQVVLNPRAAEAKPEKAPSVNVYVYANAKEGIKIVLKKDNSESEIKIPNKDGILDLERLHQEMVKVKVSHPDVFRLELSPDGEIAYDQIIAMMDKMRNRDRDKDPKIEIKDSKTEKMIETDLLFPDVVLANVVEG